MTQDRCFSRFGMPTNGTPAFAPPPDTAERLLDSLTGCAPPQHLSSPGERPVTVAGPRTARLQQATNLRAHYHLNIFAIRPPFRTVGCFFL